MLVTCNKEILINKKKKMGGGKIREKRMKVRRKSMCNKNNCRAEKDFSGRTLSFFKSK